MLPSNGAGNARSIPLSEVARFTYTEGLNQISRENGKRMVVIQANVRGRDLGGFVAEAQTKIADVKLPAGTFTEWGGQFESLQSASERLAIVVPLCFVLIFALLYMADRKSVVWGKSVSVRVDLGGSRLVKKKKK